jgi:hypothetical protein
MIVLNASAHDPSCVAGHGAHRCPFERPMGSGLLPESFATRAFDKHVSRARL